MENVLTDGVFMARIANLNNMKKATRLMRIQFRKAIKLNPDIIKKGK